MIAGKIKFNFDAAKFDKEPILDEEGKKQLEKNKQQVTEQTSSPKPSIFSGLENVLQTFTSPVEQIDKGVEKLQDNPLAGATEIGMGVANTLFSATGFPAAFAVIGSVARKLGYKKAADNWDQLLNLPSKAVDLGTKGIEKGLEAVGFDRPKQEQFIKEVVVGALKTGQPEAKILLPLLTTKGQQEIADSFDELNKTIATISTFAKLGELIPKNPLTEQKAIDENISKKQQIAKEKPRDGTGKFTTKPIEKPQNEVVKQDLIPNAEKQTSDLPTLEEVQSSSAPIKEQSEIVDNNANAIKQLADNGKTPEEISKVLNVPVEEVKNKIKPNEVENVIPKEVQVPEEIKPSDIPKDETVNQELITSDKPPEDISITKQKMNDLREEVGLPELEKTAQQHIPETYGKVKSEIENGTRNEETLIKEIESGKKDLDPTKSFELAYYLTKESNKWNATFDKIKEAQKSGDTATEVLLRSIADDSLSKIKQISDAASSVTSEWGRFGRFMQVQLAQDYSIARTMQRAELYAPEGKIPETAKSKLETLSSDIGKLQEAFKQYQIKQPQKTVEDFIAKAQRDYQFEQRKTKRAITKEELHTERQQLWVDLYKQTNVAAANIPLTPEAIKTMGRLATNYVKEGIITVEGLVDEFYKGFQGKVSKEDIMKALSGYGKESTMTKNETLSKLNSAKKEMKLLLAIEDVKSGKEPIKNQRIPTEPNIRIQNLQRELKSLTKQNIDVNDATKLKTQKTRVANNIANYEQMLKENKFEKKQRKPVIPDKELTDLKVKENQLKKQVELELYKIKRLGMTKWEKTKEVAADVANIPRTLLATADLSMPLRQGLPLGSAYPKMAYDAFKEMHKTAVSDKYFKQRMTEIETSPNARVYEKMGVDFTGVGSDLVQLAKREESFISAHILNKVPGLKHITAFSERGAVSYLNVLRQNVADWQIKLMMEKGMTPENNLKAYQDVGKLINWGTGRSDLGWMERAPGVLNAVMFSPRNFVAKLHLMNPLEYIKLAPEARKLLMREQMATLAQGMMFLNLMKLSGAQIETDPQSADFAKAKFGNTRIDMFGGFQQNFVLLARLAYGQVKSTTGKTYNLDGNKFPFSTRLDLFTRFMRSKLSPQMTIAVDALAGKDMMGNEFGSDIKQEAINRFLPMVWQDMIDAQKEIGWGALGTTILGFYGAGTQTYEPKEKKSSQPIKFNFDVNFNFNQ
jgi:hypothetical protein